MGNVALQSVVGGWQYSIDGELSGPVYRDTTSAWAAERSQREQAVAKRREVVQVAQWLHEELHNAGCVGERRAVKDVLLLLSASERKLLAKLLGRCNKHHANDEEEG